MVEFAKQNDQPLHYFHPILAESEESHTDLSVKLKKRRSMKLDGAFKAPTQTMSCCPHYNPHKKEDKNPLSTIILSFHA